MLIVTNMWPRPDRPAFGAFVESQVDSLAAQGVQTRVLAIEGDRSPLAYLGAIRRVRLEVRQWRPDLVHAHFGLAGWSASFQRAPLVISICGDDILGAPGPNGRPTLKSRLMVRLTRSAVGRAAGVICKSANLLAALPAGASRQAAVVIPNGVDLTRFSPGGREEARRALGLDPAAPIVLFPHDRAQPAQKRFALAAAAMDRLRLERPDVRLLHVSGEPPARMPAYYRAANCMLLTSRSEGSPNTVKEALACGLPVVSVPVGDVAYWVSRVTGCRLVPDDARSLARAMAEVLVEDQAVDSSLLLDELDARTVAARVRAVYDSLLGAGAGG